MQDAEETKTRPSRINTIRRARISTNISRRAAITPRATLATHRHEMETTRARRSREPSTSPRAPSTKMIKTRVARARITDSSISRRGRSRITTRRTSLTRSKATGSTTRRIVTDRGVATTNSRIKTKAIGEATKEWRGTSLTTTNSSLINKTCSRSTSQKCESSS